MNDIRNLETAIRAVIDEGAHAQASSCVYNKSHTQYPALYPNCQSIGGNGCPLPLYKRYGRSFNSPYYAYELVTELKKAVKIPIQVHSHYTSGLASMTYMKAVEAGADVIDCAISPMAFGTSQPATEPMVAALKDTPYDTGLDLDLLSQIAEYFRPLREKYLSEGLLNPRVLSVDVNTLLYQVPGGMLSNLVSQLKQQNKLDKYDEVLKEVPRVREDLGYPPLVPQQARS